jgi:hypothetical protein
MVAYYPLNGNFKDNLGDSAKDFIPGTGDSQPSFAPGRFGPAVVFDGIDDYAVTTSPLTKDGSIAFWINTTDSYSLGSKEFWNGKGIVNANVVGCGYDVGDWGICLQATNKVGFGIGAPICEDTRDILSDTSINDGEWHFVVCTRNGKTGEFQIFVDQGGPESCDTLVPVYDLKPVPVYLGATIYDSPIPEPGRFLNGSIDELMFFDHVLGPHEMEMIRTFNTLYRPPVPLYPRPLPDPQGENVPSGSLFQWVSDYSGPGVVDRYRLRVDSNLSRIIDPNDGDPSDYLVWQDDILPRSPTDPNASWTVHGIQDETPYYWRVDTLVLEPNTPFPTPPIPVWMRGPVWSFNGISAFPKISGPNDVTILPDENTHEIVEPQVELTADIVTVFPIASIEWLKNGQPLIIDNVRYFVENTPSLSDAKHSTLTIVGPSESDEADYACRVMLSNGNSDTGPEARIYVASEVLVHRWSFNQSPLDTVVTDSVGGAHGLIVDPNGNTIAFDGAGSLVWSNPDSPSIRLSGDPNTAVWVDLPDGLISGLRNNLTLMAWYTWNDPQTRPYARLFSAGRSDAGGEGDSAGQGDFIEIIAKDSAGRMGFCSEKTQAPGAAAVNADLANGSLGQEVCLAVVWDGRAGQISLYQNGQLKDTAPTNTDLSALEDVNIWLGRSQWPDHPLFVGALNELRIYNVPLNAPWIKALVDLGPDGEAVDPAVVDPCIYPVAPLVDLNEDCSIDIEDFAILAQHWLECGRVSCLP